MSGKEIKRFLGELHDYIKENALEELGKFCQWDFALELRGGKLLLFALKVQPQIEQKTIGGE